MKALFKLNDDIIYDIEIPKEGTKIKDKSIIIEMVWDTFEKEIAVELVRR